MVDFDDNEFIEQILLEGRRNIDELLKQLEHEDCNTAELLAQLERDADRGADNG